jgi:hypothetical protein
MFIVRLVSFASGMSCSLSFIDLIGLMCIEMSSLRMASGVTFRVTSLLLKTVVGFEY